NSLLKMVCPETLVMWIWEIFSVRDWMVNLPWVGLGKHDIIWPSSIVFNPTNAGSIITESPARLKLTGFSRKVNPPAWEGKMYTVDKTEILLLIFKSTVPSKP